MNDMMNFCEFLLENCLQFLLQFFLICYYYSGIRRQTAAQAQSVVLATLSIAFRFAKKTKPQNFRMDDNESSYTVVKRIIWFLSLFVVLTYCSLYNVQTFFGKGQEIYGDLFKFGRLCILSIDGCVCFILFALKFIFKTLKPVKRNCFLLVASIFFFTSAALKAFFFAGTITWNYPWLNENYISVVKIICITQFVLNSLFFFYFLRALFTISTFSDIWYLDKVIGLNQNCFISNMLIFLFALFATSITLYFFVLFTGLVEFKGMMF